MQHPVSIDDVTLHAIPTKPSLFVDPAPAAEPAQREMPPVFMPPQPERIMQRPRMPRIEDLPVPAQRQLRAKQGEPLEQEHPEKQRMSLLQRLASAGLGRKAEEAPAAAAEPEMTQRPAPRIDQRPLESRGPVSDYAPRAPQAPHGAPHGAPQGLDMNGRPAPVHSQMDDDQLDIPAFLRRQAN
jgi:cell division protein FtsZ